VGDVNVNTVACQLGEGPITSEQILKFDLRSDQCFRISVMD